MVTHIKGTKVTLTKSKWECRGTALIKYIIDGLLKQDPPFFLFLVGILIRVIHTCKVQGPIS